MHIVSQVEGELAPGCDGLDVLRSTFPAGTVAGAPKVRAMEIIEELEPTRRGPYAGAVGYLGFGGNLDFCITIRSFAIHRGQVYLQVGAGIVADSDPGREYQETVNKGLALMRALERAEEGLG
jgi:anthranilate synthase component 1